MPQIVREGDSPQREYPRKSCPYHELKKMASKYKPKKPITRQLKAKSPNDKLLGGGQRWNDL